MRRHNVLKWIIVALTLTMLDAAWPMRDSVSAIAPSAGNTQWTGTFTFTMSENYNSAPGSDNKDEITATCMARVLRHADGTASAIATYSYHEVRTSGSQTNGNLFTTILDVPSTSASFSPYASVPNFTLNGNGTYNVYAVAPIVRTTETQSTQQQGSSANTTSYESSGSCDPAGAEEATAKLQAGMTQTDSETHTLLNGTTVTMEWTIQDPTLAPINSNQNSSTPKKGDTSPTGKMKVTNNGIDASLSWKGWELGYSGDWKATQAKSTAPPKVTSPDGKVQITIQQPAAAQSAAKSTAPTSAPPGSAAPTGPARSTIKQVGQAAGPIKSISFKPFTIGTLSGQIGMISLGNSKDSLLIAVVGAGPKQIITQTLIKPGSSPLDLVEAGIAIGSLHQGS